MQLSFVYFLHSFSMTELNQNNMQELLLISELLSAVLK